MDFCERECVNLTEGSWKREGDHICGIRELKMKRYFVLCVLDSISNKELLNFLNIFFTVHNSF